MKTKKIKETSEKIAQLYQITINDNKKLDLVCTTTTGEKKDVEIFYYRFPQVLQRVKEIIKQIAKTDLPETEMDLRALNVDCLCCGACCQVYTIKITKEDVFRIAAFLGITVDEFKEKYVDSITASWVEDSMTIKKVFVPENGLFRCIFLQKLDDERFFCPLHAVKPEVCRNYITGSIESCHPRWKLKMQKIKLVNLYEFMADITITNGKIQNLTYQRAHNVLKSVRELVKELETIDLKKEREDLERKTYKYPCIRCGNCCIKTKYIVVNDEDIDRLAEFFTVSRQEIIDKYTDFMPSWKDGVYYLKKITTAPNRPYWCVFLKKESPDHKFLTCSVHPARPQICRCYEPGNLAECFARKSWLADKEYEYEGMQA